MQQSPASFLRSGGGAGGWEETEAVAAAAAAVKAEDWAVGAMGQ